MVKRVELGQWPAFTTFSSWQPLSETRGLLWAWFCQKLDFGKTIANGSPGWLVNVAPLLSTFGHLPAREGDCQIHQWP